MTITTSGLTKRFGNVTAVNDVDLRVRDGEVFGFLGPNGAGKSTTIAMLMDYVRPTDGTAEILGMDAQRDHVAIAERVGVLPDGFRPYRRLSGRKHLAFAIRVTGSDDDPARLLERVGLDGAGGRPAGEYSTGMTQRLKLALALVGDPDVLILDEPSSGLDPSGVKRLREIVRAERDRGTTVFFSSHVLEQVEAVCDRIGILVDGRLVVSGGVDELRADRGSGVRLAVDVAERSRDLVATLEAMDAVSDVAAASPSEDESGRGGRIEVSMTDRTAKAAVLRRIEERTTVEDFSADEESLETLFERYATEGRP